MENDSRREFLKKTGLLAGGFGLWNTLPASIRKAVEIDPVKGSTFESAEHIVLLMQENRSFDHCFGSLNGVRGFNDPRAIQLPDGLPVWLQTNKKGETFTPFHLDIRDTKITWMGGMPHSWSDQVDARNGGKCDNWLDAKKTHYKGFEDKPMTMGYYKRKDIPFNYALADAFTVCDQHFCSALTGTTPNRAYFFSGALRKDGKASEPALVYNDQIDFHEDIDWQTFPEILEENSISWKLYQNEISVGHELDKTENFWLGNFTDNALEWFQKYHVRRSEKYLNYVKKALVATTAGITETNAQIREDPADEKLTQKLAKLQSSLEKLQDQLVKTETALKTPISEKESAMHEKAFQTNASDPDYNKVEELQYDDAGASRTMTVPKSDILANFRSDVATGQLPAVSWLVAPQAFSDHPSAPWFGAWYVSEVLDILTENPEVWKKTIFILTYDENDGYFDHVPPFVAPNAKDAHSGAVSKSIKSIENEYVTFEDELKWKRLKDPKGVRESPIGLGYRVPFIVASPWSRGGYVNSQVFDHTSVVQFLEGFVQRKTKQNIQSRNISDWRRAVCGDLSSVFRPWNGEKINLPDFLQRNAWLTKIDEAKYKPEPNGIEPLTRSEIENPALAGDKFIQEKGPRPANALPYELQADGSLNKEKTAFQLTLAAGKKIFKGKAAGAPFTVYAANAYGQDGKWEKGKNWNFAVAAGENLVYDFDLSQFEDQQYHLALHGPNGFFREFTGDKNDPELLVSLSCQTSNRNKYAQLTLDIKNETSSVQNILITDNAYGQNNIHKRLLPNSQEQISLSLEKTTGWYDFTLTIDKVKNCQKRYAGRAENGHETTSDPQLEKKS